MSQSPEYFDISPLVSERTAVFPGDEPYARRPALEFAKGDHLALSSISTTLHIGAHVDAPSHYHREGVAIHQRKLNPYFGRCQVISVDVPRGERIQPANLDGKKIDARRVLFRTGSFPDPQKWNGDFNALGAPLIRYLAAQRVKLVGIDTPSVDPAEDKVLEAHQALHRHDMANLEGIVLEGVPDGIYTLVALPLRLEGADGSPVRAVLWKGMPND